MAAATSIDNILIERWRLSCMKSQSYEYLATRWRLLVSGLWVHYVSLEYIVYQVKSTVRVHYRPLPHSCAQNLWNEYIVDCCFHAERVHYRPEKPDTFVLWPGALWYFYGPELDLRYGIWFPLGDSQYAWMSDKHLIRWDVYSVVTSNLPGGIKYKLINNWL